jgi:trigger factor
MQIATQSLPKSSVELTIELAVDELTPYLHRAAEALSREHKVAGFRPGKLPYDLAVQRFGAMAILEQAADQAVRDAYVRAVREQKLKTIGHPKIEITTLAPENPVKFTATVALLPQVTIPELGTIRVARRTVATKPEEVDRALDDLRKLQPKETPVDRPAEATDKVTINLDLVRDGVPIDGGQARGHHVFLTEQHYLPEVRDALIGMRKDETKTFPLTFPADHYQKHLAGSTVTATVTVQDVFGVELPAIDDTFAGSLGQKDLAALRSIVEQNLTEESARKARDAEEISLLDAIIAKAKFDDLPDMLITGEAHRMTDELERGVVQQGLPFEEYLKKIGKTRDQVFIGFAPEAVRRVKVALLTRAVAETNAIAPDRTEIETEVQAQLARYQDDPELRDRIQSEESRDYVGTMIRNRKVIAWLREKVQWDDK